MVKVRRRGFWVPNRGLLSRDFSSSRVPFGYYCHEIAIRFHFQTLIESGVVPLEDRDDFGDMPIHYAAKSGGFSIIITLIETGVQPSLTGTYVFQVGGLGFGFVRDMQGFCLHPTLD